MVKLLVIEKKYGGRRAGKNAPEKIDAFRCLKSLLERELILNFKFVLVMESSMSDISISKLLNQTLSNLGPDFNSTLEDHCYDVVNELVIEKAGN